MPQMAPLPWSILLISTIFILMYTTTIIFFSFQNTKFNITKKYKKTFLIKW